MNSHALGYISSPTAKLGTKPAPFMAAFSSRGPNTVTSEILKVLLLILSFFHVHMFVIISSSNDLVKYKRTKNPLYFDMYSLI